MKKFQLKQQQGFSILAVILVIVAVIVAIGVWALSGQTNTSNSSTSSIDIQAASIINDGASIKLAFDALIINGLTASNIAFMPSLVSPNNILDPTTGIALPKLNPNALKASPNTTEGFWVFNKASFYGDNVGTSALDIAIAVGGIKDSVCQRINFNLYGFAEKPTYLGGSGSSTLTLGASVLAPTVRITAGVKDLATSTPSANLSTNGWTSGCIGSSVPDSNTYFKILQTN